MSHFELYCLLMLDGIKCTLMGINILGGIFLVVGGIICISWKMDGKSFTPTLSRVLIKVCAVIGICLAVTTFLPTTKQAAVIWLVPAVVNNQAVQETTDEAASVLRGLVKDWAAEFKPKNPVGRKGGEI